MDSSGCLGPRVALPEHLLPTLRCNRRLREATWTPLPGGECRRRRRRLAP